MTTLTIPTWFLWVIAIGMTVSGLLDIASFVLTRWRWKLEGEKRYREGVAHGQKSATLARLVKKGMEANR